MLSNLPGRATLAFLVRFAAAFGLTVLLAALCVPAAHAAVVSADLTIIVNGPAAAPIGSAFAYTVVMTNAGPDSADGASVAAIPPVESTGVTASCTGSSGGASCPTSIAVASGSLHGTVPVLPPNGSVTIVVRGLYGPGSSAFLSASVSTPDGVTDPDPASNASRTDTTLVDRSADVSVRMSVDVETAAFGQTVRYTTAVANRGPDDLLGIGLSDYFRSVSLGAQNGLSVSGALSCDASPADAAPCPSSLTSPSPYVGALKGSELPVSWPSADVPAGKTLYLTMALRFTTTHCTTFDVRQVQQSVELHAPHGTSLTGTTRAESPPVTLGPCTGLGVQVLMSNPTPHAGEPLTTTVRVANSGAASSVAVPVTVQLPEAGGLSVGISKNRLSCATSFGAVTCPSDLSYDPAKRTITGTVPEIPCGGSFSISLTGKAGVVPGSRYTTTASLESGAQTQSHPASVTYTIVNSKARISGSVTLQGAASPHSLTFAGTVHCAQQGSVPFSLTIPAGLGGTALGIGSPIWLHDECTVTITGMPAAPTGYTWAAGSGAQTQVRSPQGFPTTAFTFVLRPTTAAVVPSTGAASGNASNSSVAQAVPNATTTSTRTDSSASTAAPTDLISVVTGTADSRGTWLTAVAGTLVMLAGLGLTLGRR